MTTVAMRLSTPAPSVPVEQAKALVSRFSNRVLICGDKAFKNWDLARRTLRLLPSEDLLIIHGGSQGAESITGFLATQMRIPVAIFPIQWAEFGRTAGLRRNFEVFDIAQPTRVIAFQAEPSKETGHLLALAKERDVKIDFITHSDDTEKARLDEYIEASKSEPAKVYTPEELKAFAAERGLEVL